MAEFKIGEHLLTIDYHGVKFAVDPLAVKGHVEEFKKRHEKETGEPCPNYVWAEDLALWLRGHAAKKDARHDLIVQASDAEAIYNHVILTEREAYADFFTRLNSLNASALKSSDSRGGPSSGSSPTSDEFERPENSGKFDLAEG